MVEFKGETLTVERNLNKFKNLKKIKGENKVFNELKNF